MDGVAQLQAMGGGMWSAADCAAAMAATGTADGACELLLSGFTASSLGPVATVTSGRGVSQPVWSFDDGAQGWVPYDAATQRLLEAAHSRGETTVSFSFGKWTYDVSLHPGALCQTNRRTGTVRAVQRSTTGALGLSRSQHRPTPAVSAPAPAGSAATALAGTLQYSHEADISQAEMKAATRWKQLAPGSFSPDECDPITTVPFGSGPIVELKCSGTTRGTRCIFRLDSIADTLRATHGRCPSCQTRFPALSRGTQGSGTMETRCIPSQCAGFESSAAGSFHISYNFPGGRQSANMPNPGQRYSGTSREAYYPNTEAGRRAVRLLQRAFLQGQLFNVGFSPTQGRDNVTVWGIHQKSSLRGGATAHGWPDPTYFERLFSELASLGIMDEDFAKPQSASESQQEPARKRKQTHETAHAATDCSRQSCPYERILNSSSLTSEQRNLLQLLRSADSESASIEADTRAHGDHQRQQLEDTAKDIRVLLTLQKLSDELASHDTAVTRAKAEKIEAQINTFIQQERQAMADRQIGKMRELMQQRAKLVEQRKKDVEAVRLAAAKVALEQCATIQLPDSPEIALAQREQLCASLGIH